VGCTYPATRAHPKLFHALTHDSHWFATLARMPAATQPRIWTLTDQAAGNRQQAAALAA